ncbi:MAG TPA: DUF4148 domain-containing protein [Burkholderiaceae bacterium]|nr:DUF4148 domain-containing protein [Burkholderiaceae bacterium]HSC00822.1 DUF4148 domain-containing protein [Burkholderiaceae bacterium]
MTNNLRTTGHLLAALAVLAFAATIASSAHAQSASQPMSRADVKAETKAANKAGQMVPGEEDPSMKQPPPKSTRNPAERKAETKAGNKDGGYSSGKATYNAHNVKPREDLAKSTKTRTEGKAEAKQATKERKTPPAGEAAAPTK